MTEKKHKIAFLLLDEIHHLYHFISVAVWLSKKHEISILTYPDKHKLLYKTLEKLHGENVNVEQLKTLWFRAFTDKLKNRKLPRKGFWLKKNMNNLLENFDAIVFTDYYHRYVVEARKNQPFPKLIKLPHGPPGRAYSYNKDLLDFDLIFLTGKLHYKGLKKHDYLPKNYSISGYPKIDITHSKKTKYFFNNNLPVVLYNPHFDPKVTSWHTSGMRILDYFHNHKEYNLIFAPHVNLFTSKGGEKKKSIPEKYFKAENIYIDLGSNKSINMSYTKTANIYLGDVSSQVYEFILIKPRPCIFINSHQVIYEKDKNYRFWKCGEVLNSDEGLDQSLNNCFEKFKKYKSTQKKIIKKIFFIEKNSTASQRYSNAIESFLNNVP